MRIQLEELRLLFLLTLLQMNQLLIFILQIPPMFFTFHFYAITGAFIVSHAPNEN